MEAGYRIERPNRDKASSRSTRALVAALLLVSALVMLIVIVSGWSALQGAQAFQLIYVVLYVGMAFLVWRWSRGALAVGGALAIILAIFAAVAAPAWFDRDKSGFAAPDMLFGGAGPDANFLGILTILLIPLQILLIVAVTQGFRQNWHVELEVANVDDHGHLPAAA